MMENINQQEEFCYTYSAKQQEELKRIREKYESHEEDKMEQIRRLDKAVTRKASVWAFSVGIMGALIMGSGMSLTMSNLGAVLGFSAGLSMLVGIVVGIVGIMLVGIAYPIYNWIIKKEREKIAPEILRLTNELMK